MEFEVKRTSDLGSDGRQKVTINSLEELLAFLHEAGEPIIIFEPSVYGNHPSYEIEIYDGYRE